MKMILMTLKKILNKIFRKTKLSVENSVGQIFQPPEMYPSTLLKLGSSLYTRLL